MSLFYVKQKYTKGGYIMSFTDFEYNGQRLSDFGCMVCEFDTPGLKTVSMGSELTLNTINL